MKTLIQKIHLEENQSFACRRYRTPNFETNWHKHEEYELILITEGHGTVMMGDFIGEYKTGDIYFLAGNLPHWFKKHQPKITGSAVVIHFLKETFGELLMNMPEMKMIRLLLEKNNGLKITGSHRDALATQIGDIETATGFSRISLLLQCLHALSISSASIVLTEDFADHSRQVNPAIEKIIDYSFRHYLQPITLQQVATVAGMTIPTFCRFFKKNIKKTYFDFLQDLRISHACKLLASSQKPVLEVCYESGYNSWAHFSKQFKRVKAISPGKYRKQMLEV